MQFYEFIFLARSWASDRLLLALGLSRLARRADALIEGFRPGVLARLDLGWDTLHALNPKLVVCSLSGYGQTGPLSQRAGHDLNYTAMTGVLDQNRVDVVFEITEGPRSKVRQINIIGNEVFSDSELRG